LINTRLKAIKAVFIYLTPVTLPFVAVSFYPVAFSNPLALRYSSASCVILLTAIPLIEEEWLKSPGRDWLK